MMAARRRGTPNRLTTGHLPAPTGGMTTLGAASATSPSKCIQSFNLNAAEHGLRARLGSREWVTGITGTADNKVRTTISFVGSASAGTANKIFAVTSSGIWDVTASTTSPTQVWTFGVGTGSAGYGVAHAMQTSAGHFLIYCDEENGLHIYSQTSGLWTAPVMGSDPSTEISGFDPATFVHVTFWKQRLVFTLRDSSTLVYMAAGSIYGAATAFPVGARLRAGGSLVGAWNWTMDGGAGMDDRLVIVSRGGDVVVYEGTDPSSASTISIVGVWYMGDSPAGRDIVVRDGGDILLISRAGLIPLGQLVSGTLKQEQYPTADITSLFNQLMLSKASLRGWSMRIHPEENALIVTVPGENEDVETNQLAMSLSTRGWTRYRDLPISSMEVFGGKLYFGTVDGQILINDGYVDGITLADPSSYTPVDWGILSSFQNLGNANMKRVQIIRPVLLSEQAPSYDTEARYDFDLIELGGVTQTLLSGSGWDTALWDSATWSADYSATKEMRGASGVGVHVAVAARGSAAARTILVGFDVMYESGGPR